MSTEGATILRLTNEPISRKKSVHRQTKQRAYQKVPTLLCADSVVVSDTIIIWALSARWIAKAKETRLAHYDAQIKIYKNKELVHTVLFRRFYHPRIIPALNAATRDHIDLEVIENNVRTTEHYALYLHCKPRKI